jgi:hypothetical protein
MALPSGRAISFAHRKVPFTPKRVKVLPKMAESWLELAMDS